MKGYEEIETQALYLQISVGVRAGLFSCLKLLFESQWQIITSFREEESACSDALGKWFHNPYHVL